MHVSAIWRYPVRSLRGGGLDAAEVRFDGIPGDCAVVVRAPNGHAITARALDCAVVEPRGDRRGDAVELI
jgi:uncharacterized protein YcbX